MKTIPQATTRTPLRALAFALLGCLLLGVLAILPTRATDGMRLVDQPLNEAPNSTPTAKAAAFDWTITTDKA